MTSLASVSSRKALLLFGAFFSLTGSVLAIAPEHLLFRAIRTRDDAQVTRLIRQGTPVEISTADGTTPLMSAALHGSRESVELLLQQGANPNATNERGVTPLLWAVTDQEKVELLLAHGARVNVRTEAGMTPLWSAASLPTGTTVVKQLLKGGADVAIPFGNRGSALTRSVSTGNLEMLKVFMDHAEGKGELESILRDEATLLIRRAAAQGNTGITKMICERLATMNDGVLPDPSEAVAQALRAQQPENAIILLNYNAPFNDLTRPAASPAFLFASYSDKGDTSALSALLDRGVDVSVTNEHGETALTWARRRGHPEVIEGLIKAGVPDVQDERPDLPERDINLHAGNQQQLLSDAITRSVRLLLKSSDGFLAERSCTSCHQNDVPAIAAGWARDRGLPVNQASLDRIIQRQTSPSQLSRWISRSYDLVEGAGINARAIGFRTWEYSAIGYPPDEHIEAMVWHVAAKQEANGSWTHGWSRPPLANGAFIATALAIQTLQHYPIAGRKEEFRERIARAATWLRDTKAELHQERVFQLLGLAWADQNPDALNDLTDELLQLQRSDGGWSQLPNLSSDAWATGQSLIALHMAGGLPTTDAAYQRGLRFLLNTQFDDGSWFVRSRSFPFQEYFESGFPHGRDQWISAPATAWAAMAMMLALEPAGGKLPSSIEVSIPKGRNEGYQAPGSGTDDDIPIAEKISFARDLKPILERSCVGCHSGDEAQGNLVMTDRVSLLRGGDSGDSALVPGRSAESLVFVAAAGSEDGLSMPPADERQKFPRLSARELVLLKQWIDDGAPWPEGLILKRGGY